MNTLLTITALAALLVAIGSFAYYSYTTYVSHQWIYKIFNIKYQSILEVESTQFQKTFRLKLTRAGITQKELIEVAFAGVIGGIALGALTFILNMSFFMNLIIIILGLGIAISTAPLYLEEQIKQRIKRIEMDLSIFIDLLIIILEGGGGLNNAIDQVSKDAVGVVGKDLLDEFRLFKNDYVTYSSEVAYASLAQRTGSEAIGTMVNFMRLSEETGIGVKTIFENQSREIKEKDMLEVEKKAAMLNINLTLVMFLFILPSMIAMIAFPLSGDGLMSGF